MIDALLRILELRFYRSSIRGHSPDILREAPPLLHTYETTTNAFTKQSFSFGFPEYANFIA